MVYDRAIGPAAAEVNVSFGIRTQTTRTAILRGEEELRGIYYYNDLY